MAFYSTCGALDFLVHSLIPLGIDWKLLVELFIWAEPTKLSKQTLHPSLF